MPWRPNLPLTCVPSATSHLVHVQAIQEKYEVVVCDTSGRLHTNAQLMDELAKCKRAIGKRLAGAPHETLLVLDGTTGHILVTSSSVYIRLTIIHGHMLEQTDITLHVVCVPASSYG